MQLTVATGHDGDTPPGEAIDSRRRVPAKGNQDGDAIYPSTGAVAGIPELVGAVGALLTITLVVAVLMLVVSAATGAIGHALGSWHVAAQVQAGVSVQTLQRTTAR